MHQFFQITRSISQSLNSFFSPYNLHFSEWGVILTLMERGAMTQRELASYLHIEPSAVSRTLVRLEKKGYIKRKVGADRREKQVFLTELAKKQYQVWDDIAGQHRQNLLMDLSEEKKKELYMVLKTISQKASQQCKDDRCEIEGEIAEC
jgi:Transcriptional regulators